MVAVPYSLQEGSHQAGHVTLIMQNSGSSVVEVVRRFALYPDRNFMDCCLRKVGKPVELANILVEMWQTLSQPDRAGEPLTRAPGLFATIIVAKKSLC